MTTTTASTTIQKSLDIPDANTLADVLRQIRLGTMLSPVKVVVAGTPALSSIDITDPQILAFCTISGVSIPTGESLPAALVVKTLRVTTSGTANSVGAYVVGDVAATMLTPTAGTNVGLARISDDGTTLTFLTTVTGFVIEYVPRSRIDLAAIFASPSP